jgi:hypothetical protein
MHPTILLLLRYHGNIFTEPLPNHNKGIHIQLQTQGRWANTGTAGGSVFLWPDPNLYKEDNFLLRTVVSSQSYHAEAKKLIDSIIEPIA